jgi:hypothetical protein
MRCKPLDQAQPAQFSVSDISAGALNPSQVGPKAPEYCAQSRRSQGLLDIRANYGAGACPSQEPAREWSMPAEFSGRGDSGPSEARVNRRARPLGRSDSASCPYSRHLART